jgi:hypothetical protein
MFKPKFKEAEEFMLCKHPGALIMVKLFLGNRMLILIDWMLLLSKEMFQLFDCLSTHLFAVFVYSGGKKTKK